MKSNDDFFVRDGQVQMLLREHDWSDFPTGGPERWPAPLRITMALMLDSRLPMRLLWGPELRILYNDAYIEILGHKHPAALGRPYWEVWPEVAQETGSIVRRTLDGIPTVSENIELQVLRHGHLEQVWFTLSFSPIRDDDGNVAGVFSTCIETTAQVLSERRLLAESAHLYRLFEQAPGFIAVLHGPQHVFELVNPAYLQLVGHRDFIGKPVRDVIPEAERQGFVALLDHVYASGEPFIGRGLPIRLQPVPGGAPVERYVDFVYQPIIDTEGRISGIFVEGADVTEQYRAQLALTEVNRELAEKVRCLEEAERRHTFQIELADLLRGLGEPAEIFARTAAHLGRYLQVARVLYGDYDIGNQNITFHSNYTDGVVGEIKGSYPTSTFGLADFASLEGGTTWICGNLADDPRTAGTNTWRNFAAFQIHAAVVVPLNRDGEMIASLFINDSKPRDWTREEVRLIEDSAERVWNAVERTRAEAALRQADRRKDEFLAMLAHELRNPLAPISAAAELMAMVPLDDARLKQTSQIIARQVRHMNGLVDDLLDVSRVTSGLATISHVMQDLKSIVSNAVEQVRPAMEARRHHLGLHLPAESAHVMGDAKRLVQILTNLLNNAAKYTPEGGQIALRMQVDDHHVIMDVEDNGIGIAPEMQLRVFELFAQAERTSDRSQGGLGLGLALVKSLVELHGGKVTCVSAGIGKGSRFTVTLPRLRNEIAIPERRRRDRNVPTPVEALRVLVVDDNADAAEMLAMFVEACGHQVLIEHAPMPALKSARNEAPDVCLLDIGLPDIDGNELARRLRAQPETAKSVLIAVTGYGQEHHREASRAAGFDHHFVKPVDTAKLSALLAEISGSRTNAALLPIRRQ